MSNNIPTPKDDESRSRLLRLPAEIRNVVYEYALTADDQTLYCCALYPKLHTNPSAPQDDSNHLQHLGPQHRYETAGLEFEYNTIVFYDLAPNEEQVYNHVPLWDGPSPMSVITFFLGYISQQPTEMLRKVKRIVIRTHSEKAKDDGGVSLGHMRKLNVSDIRRLGAFFEFARNNPNIVVEWVPRGLGLGLVNTYSTHSIVEAVQIQSAYRNGGVVDPELAERLQNNELWGWQSLRLETTDLYDSLNMVNGGKEIPQNLRIMPEGVFDEARLNVKHPFSDAWQSLTEQDRQRWTEQVRAWFENGI